MFTTNFFETDVNWTIRFWDDCSIVSSFHRIYIEEFLGCRAVPTTLWQKESSLYANFNNFEVDLNAEKKLG